MFLSTRPRLQIEHGVQRGNPAATFGDKPCRPYMRPQPTPTVSLRKAQAAPCEGLTTRRVGTHLCVEQLGGLVC